MKLKIILILGTSSLEKNGTFLNSKEREVYMFFLKPEVKNSHAPPEVIWPRLEYGDCSPRVWERISILFPT